MLIDWFTVAAQIVNFLILVFLLHRFLYRPIVGHMTERENKIRQRLEEAAEKKKGAQNLIEKYQLKLDNLDKETGKKIEQAEKQADLRKTEILAQARKDVEDQRAKWLQALDKEKEAFASKFKKRGSQEILKYVRRIIDDLADEPLNNRLTQVLATKIGNLDQDDRKKLRHAADTDKIIVRSTCELAAPEQRKLTTIFHEICGKDAAIVYQIDPEGPLGIEARAGNIRLSWGIENYLEELQSRVISLVEEKAHEHRMGNENGSNDKNGEKEDKEEDEKHS